MDCGKVVNGGAEVQFTAALSQECVYDPSKECSVIKVMDELKNVIFITMKQFMYGIFCSHFQTLYTF